MHVEKTKQYLVLTFQYIRLDNWLQLDKKPLFLNNNR